LALLYVVSDGLRNRLTAFIGQIVIIIRLSHPAERIMFFYAHVFTSL
jgi:hypothetical protein